jgi:hypothetical protein
MAGHQLCPRSPTRREPPAESLRHSAPRELPVRSLLPLAPREPPAGPLCPLATPATLWLFSAGRRHSKPQ